MGKAFTSEGSVVGIRKWHPATMHEIDIHMPSTDMGKWKTIQRIVCKVDDEGEFRDYTPGVWNAEKKVCTVFIETEHKGCGSSWANALRVGDPVIFAATHAAQLPSRPGKIICFGDGSATGHFLALKQLAGGGQYPMEAVIFLNDEYILPAAFTAAHPEFTFVMKPHGSSLEALQQFSETKVLGDYTTIYIAGNIPMVSGLRKFFKKNPYLNARIFAHGFWS